MASLRVPYKNVDGVDIPTDVYLPREFRKEAAPVLIMIHGGAFMLGASTFNNADQIQDCVDRGWVVLAIEHRLCPGIDVLQGPMADVRDAVVWAQDGGLASALKTNGINVPVDSKRVMVMGTSSGGHLALTTAWTTPTPPLAILDFYGAKSFASPFWTTPLRSMPPHFHAPLPPSTTAAVRAETTVFIGGTSLEGHAADPSHPNPALRQAFAMHTIATGAVLSAIWPCYPSDLHLIDPLLNVSSKWPPTAIVHGSHDTTIPISLSRELEGRLREEGVETGFFEVQGEGHTFAGKMAKGSQTWESQRRGFEWLAQRLEESY
ncbi:hypothetical protein SVAN01_11810 [Stagonosporopsis vannaccii]|nr:hypothetical protein SVAN01_11810 [Stagonosporopsis vannaccii]